MSLQETNVMSDVPTNGQATAPAPSIGSGVGKLASEVLTLLELQWRLLVIDVKQGTVKVKTALLLCIVGVSFAGAAVAMGLGGLGLGVAALMAWPIWAGFCVAAVFGAIMAAAMLLGAVKFFQETGNVFQRSQDEFSRNIATFKNTLNNG